MNRSRTRSEREIRGDRGKPESLNRRRLKGPFHRTIIDHAVERIKIPPSLDRLGRSLDRSIGWSLRERIIGLAKARFLLIADPWNVLPS